MQTQTKLTIATYNVQFCTNSIKIIENIENLAKKGVEVFCLQEIINLPNQKPILEMITKQLGAQWKASFHTGEEQSKLSIGTGILWNSNKLHLEREEKILLPKIKKLAFHEFIFDKLIGGLATPLQRRTTSCYFRFNNKILCITSLHTDNVGGMTHRIKQITFLLSRLQQIQKADYEIICGDFNNFDLLQTGKEKQAIHNLLGKNFIEASENVGWTADLHNIDMQHSFRTFRWFIQTFNVHLRRQLDYIWIKNFEVTSCSKVALQGSDHFPVICNLKINQ